MWSVFGDESSDETKQRVFAVAGVIGSEEMWEDLETAWLDALVVSRFMPLIVRRTKRDYKHFDHAENQQLYTDLTVMLGESGLGGMGIAMDLAAQRKFFPESNDGSYYQGFTNVIEEMKQCAQRNQETVRFTFDERKESEHNTSLLYKIAAELPEYQDTMFDDISFGNHRETPRLQVADLFARETMKTLDNIVGPVKRDPRKSWLALADTRLICYQSLRGRVVRRS